MKKNKKISTKPFFSVVTCTRNSEKYIKQNIESVKNQSYTNFEHIIIDGQSTDDTLLLLRQQKKSYSLLKLHTAVPRGISDALNTGVLYSQGTYIIHLNSDDYFHSADVLQDVYDFLQRTPRVDVLYGMIKTVEDDDTPIGIFPKYSVFQSANAVLLRYFNFVPHQATFVRRTVFERFGMFDTALAANMDYDFWLRIINKTRWQFIDTVISNYRVRSGAQSSSKENIRTNTEHLRVVLERHLSHSEVVLVELFNMIISRLYNMSR